METGFERVLVDIDGRKLVFTIGKDGILWKLDRDTGQFVDFTEMLSQTSSSLSTRARASDLSHRHRRGPDRRAGFRCPSIYGGHNWQASASRPCD